MSFEIVPLGQTLGAEIKGLDLTQKLDTETLAAVRAAWLEHLVLLFRGQSLNDEKLVAFSKQFGELDSVPTWDQFHSPGHAQVLVISNVIEAGKAIGVLGDGEAAWHTDMSYIERPPTASILHAHEIPDTGGDTSWINMYAVLDAVPPELRAEIEGLELNHDATHDSSATLRPGLDAVADVSRMPGARHPIIRRHPESGRPALYFGRRLNAYVVGMEIEQSEALLDRLWTYCSEDKFIFCHQWQLGDVVMWDNRCTMHRRGSFDPAQRRIMHRTEIIGEKPSAA
ncbi:MAG: TauD/TfdA family dioxygenase [Rhodospirillales bacterium]|nr:TauD/TfdA family dioxygenase [Rhodospirillales bacterium]